MNPLSSEASFEQEHRALAVLAIKAARNFSGTESSSDLLLYQLIWLEKWIQQNTSTAANVPQVSLDQVEGRSVGSKNQIPDIDSILDLAMSRFSKSLRLDGKNNGADKTTSSADDSIEFDPKEHQLDAMLSRLTVCHQKVSAVILPPSASAGILASSSDEPEKVEPARYQPRLQYLIEAFLQSGIYLDDLIITTGELGPNQMRKLSYALVEIPKIGVEILVCNQKDEATFVSTRPLGIDFYTANTKADLEKHTDIISRIVFNNKSDWLDQILSIVSTREIKEKVDVKNVVELRELVRTRISCEDFLAMPTAKTIEGETKNPRSEFKLGNLGLQAISSAMRVKGRVCGNNLAFYEFAAAIWGEGHSAVAEKLQHERLKNNPQLLIEAIKAEVSCEDFLAIPSNKNIDGQVTRPREEFRFKGLGIQAISSALGVEGNVHSNNRVFYELAAAIWGKEHSAIIQKLDAEKSEGNPQLLIEAIKAEVLCEEFLAMLTSKIIAGQRFYPRQDFKIKGLGLQAISSTLSVGGDVYGTNLAFYELAAAIWGEQHPALAEKLKTERLREDPQLLIETIKAEFSCEDFLAIPRSRAIGGQRSHPRQDFKLKGLGLKAISSALGLDGRNVTGNNKAYYRLAAVIWGEQHPAIVEKLQAERLRVDPQLLIETIKAEFSCEAFLAMPRSQTIGGQRTYTRQNFKLKGLGLEAISTVLGVEGRHVAGNNQAYYKLAAAIWGKDHPLISEKLAAEPLKSKEESLLNFSVLSSATIF